MAFLYPVSPLLHLISKRPVIPLTLHSHPKKRRKEKSKTPLPPETNSSPGISLQYPFLGAKTSFKGKRNGQAIPRCKASMPGEPEEERMN